MDIVRSVYDVGSSLESGFKEAVGLAADCIDNQALCEEKKILSMLYNEMAKPDGKFCVGIRETMMALEMGAVKNLIVWDGLKINRCSYMSSSITGLSESKREGKEEKKYMMDIVRSNKVLYLNEGKRLRGELKN